MNNLSSNPLFWMVWGLCAIATLLYTVPKIISRIRRGSPFPAQGEVQILYQEHWASGRSLKNLMTRFGGANNCLKLTVTPDELWTTLWSPFSLLAYVYDLEHRIKKQDILSIQEKQKFLLKKCLVVEYRRENGSLAQLELRPQKYDHFVEALQVGMVNMTGFSQLR